MFNASTIRVANTIIAAASTGGNCGGNDIISGNRNIDTDATCELDGPSDQEGVDPLLGPLADNGGAAPTHSIGGNSPAIDVGNASICPEVDQRGLPRPADGNGDGNAVCDIGAYEFFDQCPGDPAKIDPGACGCGNVETDDNANGIFDCLVNAEVKARITRAQRLDSLEPRSCQARRADLKAPPGARQACRSPGRASSSTRAPTPKLLKASRSRPSSVRAAASLDGARGRPRGARRPRSGIAADSGLRYAGRPPGVLGHLPRGGDRFYELV